MVKKGKKGTEKRGNLKNAGKKVGLHKEKGAGNDKKKGW